MTSTEHPDEYVHLRERVTRALDLDHLTRDGLGREEVAEHRRLAGLVLDALGLEQVGVMYGTEFLPYDDTTTYEAPTPAYVAHSTSQEAPDE